MVATVLAIVVVVVASVVVGASVVVVSVVVVGASVVVVGASVVVVATVVVVEVVVCSTVVEESSVSRTGKGKYKNCILRGAYASNLLALTFPEAKHACKRRQRYAQNFRDSTSQAICKENKARVSSQHLCNSATGQWAGVERLGISQMKTCKKFM